MIGRVDESNRALFDVSVSNSAGEGTSVVTVWIDTVFDGHLVFSMALIQQLRLKAFLRTEAILADGSTVTLQTFLCYVEWFGERKPCQVIANDGKFPLLGTGLLDDRRLQVDFKEKTLTLD